MKNTVMEKFKGWMSSGRLLLAGVILAGGVSGLLLAAPLTNTKAFGVGGTDQGATNCYAVVPGVGDKIGVIRYLNATSDKAGSVITIYTNTAPVSVTALFSGATNVLGSFSEFTAGDFVLVQKGNTPNDTYIKDYCATASATNFTPRLTATSIAVGDRIYKVGAVGTITVGAATKEMVGPFIWASQLGHPVLLELDGTSAVQVNVVGGEFINP